MNLASPLFPAAPFGNAFPPTTAGKAVAPCIQTGLAILLDALQRAQEVQRDAWDFAVEVSSLRGAGLTGSRLRWLVCMGYAEHAIETTQADAPHRTFHPAASLMLCGQSCLVLTPAGAALARQPDSFPQAPAELGPAPDPPSRLTLWPEVPRWDGDHHELRWGANLVKQFRRPAPNQELVLAAFEEEGWPAHTDDPLPSPLGCDAKERLHGTIKRLNRHQVHRLIRFRANGSGSGVLWESFR